LAALLTALAMVGAYLVAAVALSAPAAADGTVTVLVQGKGTVTGDGINCSEAAGSDCSGAFADEIVCPRPTRANPGVPPPGCTQIPAIATLTAQPDRDGFAFDHFEGCVASVRTCHVPVNGDKTITAVFTDVTPPSVTLTSPTDGAVVGGTVTFGANASDNDRIDHVAFFVGGGVVASDNGAPYTASIGTYGWAEGPARVQARAYDPAGNVTATATRTVTVDHSSPGLSVSGPSEQTFGPHTTQTWEFTVHDVSTVTTKCSVTIASVQPVWGACSDPAAHSVSDLPEGSYRFDVRAIDQVGLLSSATRRFSIDATPPDTTLTSGPANGALVAARTVSFGVSATDPGATVGCRVYRSGTTAPAFAPCTSATSFTASALDDGSYVFEARAVDAVGNADASPAARRFTVDATAPAVTIAKQPKQKVKTRKRKVRVKFAFASEPGATFRCTLDGKAVGCSASSSFKVKAGKHTLTVEAVDAAGNVSQPAAVSWKVKRVRKHR
jgi:predicted phage tail protein